MPVTIKETKSPAILKFELDDFIGQNIQFEFSNIDEAGLSPLAQKLFYLPFVKKVFLSANFVAIERYNIVEWDDVKEDVAQQIDEFIAAGGEIIKQAEAPKKSAISIYSESTPNPAVMKFVSNKLLTKIAVECKNIEETEASPLAKALFSFPFVKEVYVDENYISVSKFNVIEWHEVTNEIRNFIKEFLDKGGLVVDES
jgi:NFU1 iron-sulfur cluster scaffold homolog, mitochondrial